jgi:beta-N-acetylhexosaminidase
VGSSAVAAALAACGTDPATPAPPASSSPASSPSPTRVTEPLGRRIARMLIVGFRGAAVGPNDWIMKDITDRGLGGVILFDRDQLTGASRNINSPPQVTALIKTLTAASGGHLIVSIDQEGGKIARLGPQNGFPATKSQEEIGAVNSPPVTKAWAAGMARTLTGIGVNFNFAPVVDLAANPDNPAIALLDRSFSADPAVVVSCATDTIGEYRRVGVRTSLKHFPGLGSASGNTDFEAVDVSGTWTAKELVPFQQLIDTKMADTVMVTHFLNRQLEPSGKPMSLSKPVITGLLRDKMGWNGVVVTDDMQAVAITSRYGRDESVGLALEAGVDQLVFGNQAVYDPEVVQQTIAYVTGLVKAGKITEAQIDRSVARIDALWPR